MVLRSLSHAHLPRLPRLADHNLAEDVTASRSDRNIVRPMDRRATPGIGETKWVVDALRVVVRKTIK